MLRHRYRFTASVAGLVAVLGVGMAACGSSSSSGGSSGSSSSASGTPIKIGISVPEHQITDYTEAASAAQGAVRAINKEGGVNGHPLQLIVCNTGLNPNQEVACARKMLGDHVAATVGNADYTAEDTADAAYRSAGIAQIGDYPSGYGQVDPNSYLFFGGQTYANAGQIYWANKNVGKRVATIRLAFPYTAPYPGQYEKQCAKLGCQVVSVAVVPNETTTTDLSPYAAQLMKGNPDVIVPDLGPLIVPLMKAIDQLGFSGKIVEQDTNITRASYFAQPESIQKQYIIESAFPPPFAASQFPGLKTFLSEMKAERAAGDTSAPIYTNYNQDATMDAWLGVHVFAQVAAKYKAYDAASFKKAIDSDHAISLMGLLPAWNPSKVNFSQQPRASVDAWYFYTTVGNQNKLLNTTPVAVTSIVKDAF
ncbi:MAG TPA: ABC transporter substrate-binding protein [Streptosporangiaceae bacterium]|nr:ABC transporter substrate-binding protein [Streptosporangiaceae bacterium]